MSTSVHSLENKLRAFKRVCVLTRKIPYKCLKYLGKTNCKILDSVPDRIEMLVYRTGEEDSRDYSLLLWS